MRKVEKRKEKNKIKEQKGRELAAQRDSRRHAYYMSGGKGCICLNRSFARPSGAQMYLLNSSCSFPNKLQDF